MLRGISLAHVFFFLALTVNGLFCFHVRHMQAVWPNVPPVPAEKAIAGFFLGDRQFAYRATGIMLQNLGDTGGRTESLKDYDYNRLSEWFFLSNKLDPVSGFVPFLAAYYFSGTQDSKQLPPLVDYLAAVGNSPEGEKWRWLAQAVYLARFRMNDFDRAFGLAREMAALWHEGRPIWMKQMPAFIMTAKGDKAAAYALTVQILKEEVNKLDAYEINFMVSYICQRLLDPAEAAKNPLCTSEK